MKVCEMTNEEALELYKIAYKVCIDNRFKIDEDLIQDLVLEACIKLEDWDESKSAWSTYMYMIMYNKAVSLIHYNNSKKRKFKGLIISLDENISAKNTTKDKCITYEEIIPSDVDLSEELHKIECADFYQKIKYLIDEPLWLYIHGWTQKDIAAEFGVCQQRAHQYIWNNIRKIRNYCKKHNISY